MRIETREVQAALLGGRRARLDTHTVEVNQRGEVVRVLCGQVPPELVGPPDEEAREDEPSCKVCMKRDPRFNGSGMRPSTRALKAGRQA